MTLEWTVEMSVDFPDDTINRLCDLVREKGWDDDMIVHEINDEIMGWENDVYYMWGLGQTQTVIHEVQRRLGGIQINMFDEEENK